MITPVVELTWSKTRILEVYLNIAEFDTGVFGVEAASRHYFGAGPEEISLRQAAQLAAVLPAPKDRPVSQHLVDVVQRLAHPKILVLGDLILDEYVWGDAERIAVNVDSLYREYRGDGQVTPVLDLFALMAETRDAMRR